MVKKSRRKSNRRNNGSNRGGLMSGRDKPVTVTGKALLLVDLPVADSVVAFPLAVANDSALASLLGERVRAFSNVFEEFRFNRVTLKITPPSGGQVVIAYSKVLLSVSTITISNLYELDCSRLAYPTYTVPTNLTISGSSLRSGLRQWYSCQAGAGIDLVDLVNGSLYFAGDQNTTECIVEMGYSITFRGDIGPGLVPPPSPVSVLKAILPRSVGIKRA